MSSKLRSAYESEMDQMSAAFERQNWDISFHHLERAHILGQRFFKPHLQTHWWMFKIGLKRRDAREILGQIMRMIAVFPGSLFGWVPVGNTGGANVSALKPMQIPEDLKMYFDC